MPSTLRERAVAAAIEHYQQHRNLWAAYDAGREVLRERTVEGQHSVPKVRLATEWDAHCRAIERALRIEAMTPEPGDLGSGWYVGAYSDSYVNDTNWEAWSAVVRRVDDGWTWQKNGQRMGRYPSAQAAMDAADRALAQAQAQKGGADA